MPETAAGGDESEHSRQSMAGIITRLRRLLGDEGRTDWATDEPLQQVLDDDHRDNWRYVPLEAEETRRPGGGVVYLDFFSPAGVGGNWEDGVELVDSQSNPVTPAKSNLIAGRWTFSDPVPGNRVFISGRTYDLYGAAADLLAQYQAKQRGRNFDTTDASGVSMKRSQIASGTADLIAEYRAKQKCRSVSASRSDVGGC